MLESVQKINEARQAQEQDVEGPDKGEEDDDDDVRPQVVGEATSAVLELPQSDGPSLKELVSSLNADQQRVYERVKTHQVVHECGCCQCSDLQPLHMFVSGVGATGKSFLIKTVRALASELRDGDTGHTACAVTAPTGLAAFNVGGVTIHRLLQLACYFTS